VALRAFWPLPPVPLQVSRATTYLVAPRRDQGWIDYRAVLRPEQPLDALEVLDSAHLDVRNVPDTKDCSAEIGKEWLARQSAMVPTVRKMIAAGRVGRTDRQSPPPASMLPSLISALYCACLQDAIFASRSDLEQDLELMIELAAVMTNTDDSVTYALHGTVLRKAQECASKVSGLHLASSMPARRPPSELIERQRLRSLAALQMKYASKNSVDLNEAMRSANELFDAVIAGSALPSTPEFSRWDWLFHGMSEARFRLSRALGTAFARMYAVGLDRLPQDWKQGQDALRVLGAN
jgi:hypothetical protein